jgi:CubicO group peptidase (beta-lactamase class C family)
VLARRITLQICLILVLVAPLVAQQAPGLPADTIARIEAIVQAELERERIPGLSVAVAVDGQLRYTKGFGMADLENSVPAKATTRFSAASIAKPMTAAAVMQLAERGKLDLDAPIQKYCPAFPKKQWPVTARQLLGHLAGVRHYLKPGEGSGTEHFFTIAESLRLFKDDPLLHPPGTKYYYSSYGYVLLGCAIEGASGMPYDAYLQQHVWDLAGMPQTCPDDLLMLVADRARGYTRLSAQRFAQIPEAVQPRFRVGEVYNATLHDTSMKLPGAGLLSTAADLVRFALAMLEGKLVRPETRDLMWTRQKTSDGKETSYGLGWGIADPGGVRLVFHTGEQAGTSCLLVFAPEKKVAVAVMTNLEGTAPGTIVQSILQLLVPDIQPAPAPPRP